MSAGPWTFTVPRAIASQNRATVNRGRARYGYRDERARWVWDLTMAARAAGIPLASGRRRVTIVRLMGRGQRELDVPNLWGGAKLPIDALCQPRTFRGQVRPGAGLIVDDSPRWVEIEMGQERAADGRPATRITVEDLP